MMFSEPSGHSDGGTSTSNQTLRESTSNQTLSEGRKNTFVQGAEQGITIHVNLQIT